MQTHHAQVGIFLLREQGNVLAAASAGVQLASQNRASSSTYGSCRTAASLAASVLFPEPVVPTTTMRRARSIGRGVGSGDSLNGAIIDSTAGPWGTAMLPVYCGRSATLVDSSQRTDTGERGF
jgi:hypothetical protein